MREPQAQAPIPGGRLEVTPHFMHSTVRNWNEVLAHVLQMLAVEMQLGMVLGIRERGLGSSSLHWFILGPDDSSKDHEFSVRGGDVKLWRVHPRAVLPGQQPAAHVHTQPPGSSCF